ncbi:MAG: polysaccharide deacetylase family protein, partial [Mycobacteriales bacterium]
LERHRRVVGVASALAAALLAVAGCGAATGAVSPSGSHSATSPPPAASGSSTPPRVTSTPPPPPASVHADELGQIPVLMVHQVVPDPRGDYDVSPAELRAQLTALADGGFVPVTMADVASRKIDIPAGRSPVVLTFDDGSRSQLSLDAAGNPTPDCAVGILQSVAAAHPGFTATGSFYINHDAFGQSDPAPYLRWLDRHGYEVGDHTQTHADLRSLPAAAVQQQIGAVQATITAALGHGATTMALPYGAAPKPPSLALAGGSGVQAYRFDAALLVGANPASSPFSTSWVPAAVPRLRVAHRHVEYDAAYWLPRIASTRYVSDGDPAHISFPKAELGKLAAAYRAQARPY